MADQVLKSFGHIVRATPMILANGKPTILEQEAWDFAIQAAAAMDDARHEWVLGPWQCGYDDGIYEGRYDFITFMCQCPECEAEYRKGFEEGMKAEE